MAYCMGCVAVGLMVSGNVGAGCGLLLGAVFAAVGEWVLDRVDARAERKWRAGK